MEYTREEKSVNMLTKDDIPGKNGKKICEVCRVDYAVTRCEECKVYVCFGCCDVIERDPSDIDTWALLCTYCMNKQEREM